MNHMRFASMLILLVVLLLTPKAGAQEVFRNPAMEPNDEFQKALLRGRDLAVHGKFDEALVELTKAAKLKENCIECYQLLGQVNLQAGKFRDAASAYQEAI